MKYPRSLFAALLLTGASQLIADEQGLHQDLFPKEFTPWFTGPLISPSGYTAKPQHYNVEPYLYYYVYNGGYNKDWKLVPAQNFYYTVLQVQYKMGLSQWADFQVYPQVIYSAYRGSHYFNVGDLPLGFGFQLYKGPIDEIWPAVKLTLRANIPIGKYQKLSPDKQGTDALGIGSWQPAFSLVFAKYLHTARKHYIDARLAFSYQFGLPVHVKGLNSYGGAPNTRGTVHVGDSFILDASMQYNLNQRWVAVAELLYTHTNSNHFSGKTGTTSSGLPAVNTSPSSEQFSLAPAIEYNWSKNLGLIAGSWFTFSGRNSSRFASAIIAINIYI
jgi:hypothetical protein